VAMECGCAVVLLAGVLLAGYIVGVLECWSAGVLECWSAGVLECWSAGVLEFWSAACWCCLLVLLVLLVVVWCLTQSCSVA